MSKSFEHQVHGRRRLAGALLGALAFHALVGLLPFPRFAGSWGLGGATGARSGAGVHERFVAGALLGADVAVLTPPPAPVATAVPLEPPEEPDVRPPEETLPEVREPSTPETTDDDASPQAAAPGETGAANSGAAAGDGSQGQDDPGGGLLPTGPIEMELGSPRLYKHPVNPEKVVRKRKIKDDVILQLLVGIDGLVREVRVLRAIPNCEECTRNAVEAARQQRYDAVMLNGRPVEVWTSLSFHFSYRP